MKYFYITYLDRAKQSEKYPHEIYLGSFDDYYIAEKYILDGFLQSHQDKFMEMESQGDIHYEVREGSEYVPLLITNDARFYLLYKRVLTLPEFKLFCGIYKNYDTLLPIEKLMVNNGKGTFEAFEYCEKLISGEGKLAYEYQNYETWHDESGYSRLAEVESGWKIEDKFWVNEEIKMSYGW